MASSQAPIEGPLTLPLSAQVTKFVESYLTLNDLEKAAIEAGYPAEMGRVLWRRRLIRAEIERRQKAVESEVHQQIAKKRVITVDGADRALKRVTSFTKKELTETPTLATPMVRAIELSYQRTGILIDGNFIPDAGTEANKADEAPRIFRATDQAIITHQITETHQTVMTRQVEASAPVPRKAAPVIDAEPADDPWAKF